MANVHALHPNGKRGGDRRSEKAKADQAGRFNLVVEISRRREMLKQKGERGPQHRYR